MTGTDRLLVAAGGGLGALARVAVVELGPLDAAPGTLAVNVVGALLLGALLGSTPPGHRVRTLLGTGLLGGFTTFSALAVQVAGATSAAGGLTLAVASIVLGLAAAVAGLRLGAVSSASRLASER